MTNDDALRAKQEANRNQLTPTYTGINRRATALLPPPRYADAERINYQGFSDYRKFLLAIEAKQYTGCLKINSEQEKSRSGILIFQGRVLGCVFRNRDLNQYLFGEAAFGYAIENFASCDRVVEGYMLPEELAVATASLFHGHVLEVPEKAGMIGTLKLTYEYLAESKMPGCIVVSSSDEQSVCMVYLVDGKIAGVFSIEDGWMDLDYEQVRAYIEGSSAARVQACILAAGSLNEILKYTFSLSGLADRSTDVWANREVSVIPNVFYLCNHDARILSMCDNVVPLDRFIPRCGGSHPASANRSSVAINHAYHVNP